MPVHPTAVSKQFQLISDQLSWVKEISKLKKGRVGVGEIVKLAASTGFKNFEEKTKLNYLKVSSELIEKLNENPQIFRTPQEMETRQFSNSVCATKTPKYF